MEPTNQQTSVCEDSEQIHHSLAHIDTESGRPLRLTRPATDQTQALDLPITALTVDIQNNDVLFELTDPAIDEADVTGHSFDLNAARDAETLCFRNLHTKAVHKTDSGLAIYCKLPDQLDVTEYRSDVRLTLSNEMRVDAQVWQLAADVPTMGRLLDLSVTGCRIELALSGGMLMTLNQPLAEIGLEFPNGENILVNAQPRHLQLDKQNLSVGVGFLFVNCPKQQRQQLAKWTRAIEVERAVRSGRQNRFMQRQQLFQPTSQFRIRHQESTNESQTIHRQYDALIPVFYDTVCVLASTVIALRNNQALPVNALRECAIELDQWLSHDRQRFLYELCCLTEPPEIFSHSIAVAGRLTDLISTDTDLAPYRVDIMLGALVHDLGKAQFVNTTNPSLDRIAKLEAGQSLPAHVEKLLQSTAHAGLFETAHGSQVIRQINERLDGSGYPDGLIGTDLGSVGRAAQVVDRIDILTSDVSSRQPVTILSAYKQLYDQPKRFDATWLVAFMGRHGQTPIGSLAYFSNGFLAWVMRVDENSRPVRVRVVKNMTEPRRAFRDILNQVDFGQLGTFERIVNPSTYNIRPF